MYSYIVSSKMDKLLLVPSIHHTDKLMKTASLRPFASKLFVGNQQMDSPTSLGSLALLTRSCPALLKKPDPTV